MSFNINKEKKQNNYESINNGNSFQNKDRYVEDLKNKIQDNNTTVAKKNHLMLQRVKF